MSEVKFTEGKWYVSNGIFVGAKGIDDYVVSGVSNLDDAKANANLIAAAPEMYALLEAVNEWHLMQGEIGAFQVEIDKVLAKARGES